MEIKDALASKTRKWFPIVLILVVAGIGIPIAALVLSELTRFTFFRWITIFGTVGSIGLSTVLAYLYIEMRGIQENQQRLMEVEFEPEIKLGIDTNSSDIPVAVVKNVGRSAAVDVKVDLQIGEYTQSREKPFLSTGTSFEFPIVIDREPLDESRLRERIEMDFEEAEEEDIENLENIFDCSIICEDIKGDGHGFGEEIELMDELRKKSHMNTKTEIDSLDDISSGLSFIRDELREMNNDLL